MEWQQERQFWILVGKSKAERPWFWQLLPAMWSVPSGRMGACGNSASLRAQMIQGFALNVRVWINRKALCRILHMWLGQSYHVPDHLSNSSNQRDSTLAQRRQTVQVFSPTTLPYSPQESVWGRHIAPHAPFFQPSNPVSSDCFIQCNMGCGTGCVNCMSGQNSTIG